MRRVRARALAALVLSAQVASAQTAFSDSLVQAPTLQAPERGSVAGQYSSVAFGPSDVARGGFSLPAHLLLPSERGGPEVDLAPQYSPEAGLSEWGLGWRPAPLSLQRWRPAGDLDYVTDDLTGPWGHLVKGADGAWYTAGLQSHVRIEAVGAGFVARLPNGSQWVFDRRVDAVLGTYAWYVTSITSAAGRRTELSYVANPSGRLFLSKVLYGASPGRPMQYEVDYEYESIPQAFSDFRSGMALVLDRRVRVARMKVLVGGAMNERWAYSIGYQNDGFAYQGGAVGQAFLLTRIQRTFASGAVEPAVTYAYSSAAERLATASFRSVPKLASAIAQYGPSVFQANRAAFVDVDLDGRVDFENAVDGSIYRQTDDTYVVEPLAQPAPADAIGRCRPAPSYSNPPRRLAELRIARSPGDEPHQVVAMINNAVYTALTICDRAGKVVSSQRIPYGWSFGPNLRLADLNRDSQPDLIRVYNGGYQTIANASSSAGFAVGPVRQGTLTPAVTPGATWLQDMNGDSVVDLVVRSGSTLVVWRGKGNFQFEPAGSTSRLFWKSGTAVANLAGYELTFLDANKDGLTDLLLATSVSAALFVNTGASFQQVDVPGLAFVNSTTTRVVAADLAGSGDTELALVKGGVAYSLALVGADTGLMRAADDGKGNVLRFGYGRSPAVAGARHREAVLTSLTVETTGQEPVTYGFDYQAPTVHSHGLFLVGFGGVTRTGSAHTWSETFLNSDTLSGLRVSGQRHDVNSPLADSFDQNEFEDVPYQGIPWKRLKATVSGVRSPDGTQVASERTDFLDYESEVCARTVERTGAAGKLRTVILGRRCLVSALRCTVCPRGLTSQGSGLTAERTSRTLVSSTATPSDRSPGSPAWRRPRTP